jgi:hypothetical protein
MSASDLSNFGGAPTGSSTPSLVWVSSFSCPGKDPLVKPFYESVQHTTKPTAAELTAIVLNSFEAAGFTGTRSEMSPSLSSSSLSHCIIGLHSSNSDVELIVAIKTQPALKIGEMLFRLEEFEI